MSKPVYEFDTAERAQQVGLKGWAQAVKDRLHLNGFGKGARAGSVSEFVLKQRQITEGVSSLREDVQALREHVARALPTSVASEVKSCLK